MLDFLTFPISTRFADTVQSNQTWEITNRGTENTFKHYYIYLSNVFFSILFMQEVL